MNLTDDKSVSLISTTAMHCKTFVGSIESQQWNSQYNNISRKERILEVRKQESLINRTQVNAFSTKQRELNDDAVRGQKYDEYMKKKALIEQLLEEKKRQEIEREENIKRTIGYVM